jgi:hypothetical protein
LFVLIDWKLQSKGPVKMTDTPAPYTAHLTPDEQEFLAHFFRRALNLHARGAVSPESVLDYLQLVTDALDPESPECFAAIRTALEDAWRQADG